MKFLIYLQFGFDIKRDSMICRDVMPGSVWPVRVQSKFGGYIDVGDEMDVDLKKCHQHPKIVINVM